MKKAKIVLINEDGESTEMKESPYDTEDILQALLEKYPNLLAGEQINPEEPIKWLLIKREMGIPDSEASNGRWSLDHLFVDNLGIPTFVECKRATDTRARREVVAQMLDYAANAIQYWPIEKMRQEAAETAQKDGGNLDAILSEFLEITDEEELEKFWADVAGNLENGKIRLIFVADYIHKELRRIIEFLNEQMERTEVIAVEIKQYKSESKDKIKVMVPRVIGMTESARQTKKTDRRKYAWSLEEFRANVVNDNAGQIIKELLKVGEEWVSDNLINFEGGKGNQPTMKFRVGENRNLVTLEANGAVRVYFGFWKLPEEKKEKLKNELIDILKNEDEIKRKKEPNITPLIMKYDTDLKRLKMWLKKALDMILNDIEDNR